MEQKKTLFLKKKHIFTWVGVFLFGFFIWSLVGFFFPSSIEKFTFYSVKKDEITGIRYLDDIFSEIEVQTNKEYSQIKNKKLLLDVYQPKNDTTPERAAIIWVHGGGFFYGNKERMQLYAKKFAQKGFVSVSINYQLGEKDLGDPNGISVPSLIKKPIVIQAQHDAQTAVRWLKAHAKDYHINPDLIFIGGESAGGIVAILVGYNSENAPQREYSEYSPRVAGVVSISGISDPKYISGEDPPLIMFHGENDPIIRFSDVKEFQNTLEKFPIAHEFHNYPEAGHLLESSLDDIFSQTSRFLWFILQR